MTTPSTPGVLQRFHSPSVNLAGVIPLPEPGAFWLRFETAAGAGEGKLFLPDGPSERAVIFEPGFPGDGAPRFDRLHATTLRQAGYIVWVARHSGAFADGPHAAQYVGCSERQEMARREGHETLGRPGPHSIDEWLVEPLVALQALGPVAREMAVIGHSFGGLAVLYSLSTLVARADPLLDQVKKAITLAGTVGRLRSAGDPNFLGWRRAMDDDWTKERVAIGDTERNMEAFRRAHTLIHDPAVRLPARIDLIHLIAWGDRPENVDEAVHPTDTLDILASQGRGTLVIDKTQWSDPATGRDAHDMENLQTATLLDWLQNDQPRPSHIQILER